MINTVIVESRKPRLRADTFFLFFFFSVSFRGSIGINSFEAYLPGITDETPDMTNFKARRLYSSVLLSFKGKPASGPHTFKWTLNGTTLDPASYVEISSGSSALRVHGRSLVNEGEYQVFVSNEFGTLFSRKIKLKFSGKYALYLYFLTLWMLNHS